MVFWEKPLNLWSLDFQDKLKQMKTENVKVKSEIVLWIQKSSIKKTSTSSKVIF